MLTIFIFIGIATTFARKAFDKSRNRYLWGTIGVVSYYLIQIIAGILIALIKPEWLANNALLTGISIGIGFSGVGIAYYILNKLPDPTETSEVDSDLLDSKLD